MSEHFIIFGLPRSMTAWVSCFLTCGDVFCQHDLSGHHPEDWMDRIQQPFPVSGIADTGAALKAKELLMRFPNAKTVWIYRSPEECAKSTARAYGIDLQWASLISGEAITKFDHGSINLNNHLKIDFVELQNPETLLRLWNHVAPGISIPPAHLEKMATLKVVQRPELCAERIKELVDFHQRQFQKLNEKLQKGC